MSNPICISRSCQNATKNCFAPFLVIASQCQTLFAFVQSAKMYLRSVMPLAHVSAFSAAQEAQIEFACYFFYKSLPIWNPICISRSCQNATENCFAPFLVIAGQCQTLSAFVQSAKMHLRSVLPLAHLSAFSAAQETQIEFAFLLFHTS